MALTERSRSALYLGLSDLIEEQAVQEMLSYFPARDVEEPVTKDFLRAEMADLRAEMADLRTDMADLRTDMERQFRTLQTWTIGTGTSLGGLILATSALSG